MADLTTLARVEALWQPVPSTLAAKTTALIGMASRLIRHAYPDIDARIADGSVDSDLVADVATQMVARVLDNPGGLKSVTVDDIRAERDTAVWSGLLVITDAELALLAPAATSTVMGTIIPAWPAC